jgi:hypothetical protein
MNRFSRNQGNTWRGRANQTRKENPISMLKVIVVVDVARVITALSLLELMR